MRTPTRTHKGIHLRIGSHSPRHSGFSLIEVLIAVVVLAFGMLGLAAVFPAVIRGQQTATDAVQGQSAVRSAQEYVEALAALREKVTGHQADAHLAGNGVQLRRLGWQTILADNAFSPNEEWVLPIAPASPIISPWQGRGFTIVTRNNTDFLGRLEIGQPRNAANGITGGIVIPVAARLFPQPYTGGAQNGSGSAQPKYIWDIVGRRLDAGLPNNTLAAQNDRDEKHLHDDKVQIAIFVRRVDASIRVPSTVPAGSAPFTLSDVLAGNRPDLPAGARRAPVAVNVDGTPTFDGRGPAVGAPNYAGFWNIYIRGIDNNFLPDNSASAPPWIVFTANAGAQYPIGASGQPDLRAYFRQPGQMFVDADGIVHKVIEVRARDSRNAANPSGPFVRIEPPLARGRLLTNPLQDTTVVGGVLVPVAASVITIDP